MSTLANQHQKQKQKPTTNNQQPTTNNQQPTTNNQQPTTNNQHSNFTGLLFYVYVEIHQVRRLVYDNNQRCPVS